MAGATNAPRRVPPDTVHVGSMTDNAPKPIVTLGDLAEILYPLRDRGWTRDSAVYVINQVWPAPQPRKRPRIDGHDLVGKFVRWTHGQSTIVALATQFDPEDDELYLLLDGAIHAHVWVPAAACELAVTTTADPR